jgi:hypothetical protein
MAKVFIQQGNKFFNYDNGKLIVEYKQFHLAYVEYADAKKALDQFNIDYPSYRNMEVFEYLKKT